VHSGLPRDWEAMDFNTDNNGHNNRTICACNCKHDIHRSEVRCGMNLILYEASADSDLIWMKVNLISKKKEKKREILSKHTIILYLILKACAPAHVHGKNSLSNFVVLLWVISLERQIWYNIQIGLFADAYVNKPMHVSTPLKLSAEVRNTICIYK
jgi:phosphate/sulfate permease